MGDSGIQKYHFKLGHHIKDIDRIENSIKDLQTQWDIDEKSLFQLNLVLEELISNTMFYGFSGMDKGSIEVDLAFDGTKIHVDMRDDAKAFDPTKEAKDTSGHGLDEREIGGLGIMLTQRISEDMHYERVDGINKLKFKINTESNHGN